MDTSGSVHPLLLLVLRHEPRAQDMLKKDYDLERASLQSLLLTKHELQQCVDHQVPAVSLAYLFNCISKWTVSHVTMKAQLK
jgi:hypothetical protein